jgi:DNA segregation ATPase FtsK/SpoIIIE, S-DNA-T family
MAQNTYKSNTFKKSDKEKKGRSSKKKFNLDFLKDPRLKLAAGIFMMIAGLYLFLALFSYLFTGNADQSVIKELDSAPLLESGREIENWLGLYGAITSHYFILQWFGISAFFIPPMLFVLGFRLVFQRQLLRIFPFTVFALFSGLWLCLLLGYMTLKNEGGSEWGFLGGGLGFQLAVLSDGMFGWGTFLILILTLFVFIIFFFNVTSIPAFAVKNPKPMGSDAILPEDDGVDNSTPVTYTDEKDNWPELSKEEIPEPVLMVAKPEPDVVTAKELKLDIAAPESPRKEKKAEPTFTIEEPVETEKIAEQLVEEQGLYDPTLELSNYQFPTLELLNEYDTGKAGVTQEELNQNKDKIVATLVNFKIGIQSIKATIGPTVTLYEIVPDAGIKISRIKNLEDDIALSLAALGIRIIAPIPRQGHNRHRSTK